MVTCLKSNNDNCFASKLLQKYQLLLVLGPSKSIELLIEFRNSSREYFPQWSLSYAFGLNNEQNQSIQFYGQESFERAERQYCVFASMKIESMVGGKLALPYIACRYDCLQQTEKKNTQLVLHSNQFGFRIFLYLNISGCNTSMKSAYFKIDCLQFRKQCVLNSFRKKKIISIVIDVQKLISSNNYSLGM